MLNIIKYDNANALEATWLRELTPEVITPEEIIPEVLDAEGKVVTPSQVIEAKVTPATYEQIASIAYADVQMDLLRADVLNYGGDLTEYESLIAEVEANIPPYVAPQIIVPSIVSMRQARLALLQFGLLATVDAAINAGGEADKIEWEYAAEVNRNQPLVQNMKAGLNLSDADLDALFTLAASL